MRALLPPHLSSRHKAAHHARKDAVDLAPLRDQAHHAGRRGNQRTRCGEHAAAQEALQLQCWNMYLNVGGGQRRRCVRGGQRRRSERAPRVDAKRRKDELAREKLLDAEEGVVVVNEERAPAEVVVMVFTPIGRGRDEH